MTPQEKVRELFLEKGIILSNESKHSSEGWTQVQSCPYCDSHNFHLGFTSWGLLAFNCWRCGSHPAVRTIAILCSLPVGTVAKLLEGTSCGIGESKEVFGKLRLPNGAGKLQRIHRSYLRGRGFTDETVWKQFQLMGIGQSTEWKFANRLLIPYVHKNRIVSYTCRDVTGQNEYRYVGAAKEDEAVSRKSILFGQHLAENSICIFEGELDAIRFGVGGVATGGLSYTKEQLFQMSRYPIRGVCFDNEPKALKRAQHLVKELSIYEGRTILIQLDSKDMGSATDSETQTVRRALYLV